MFPAYEAHGEGASTVVNDPPGTRLPGILLHAASGRLIASFTQVKIRIALGSAFIQVFQTS